MYPLIALMLIRTFKLHIAKQLEPETYTVTQKKLCKLIFLSELCQILTDCEHFWHRDSKENRLYCGVLIFHLT